jgi:ribosomal protein S14
MKTRKHKDNNQRLNFLRHESNNLLAQYYKKKIVSWSPDRAAACEGEAMTPLRAVATQRGGVPDPFAASQLGLQSQQDSFLIPLHSSEGYAFQYPKSLNDFYSKYKEIKPLVTLISLQEDQDGLSQGRNGRNDLQLRASTIKTCYIMKVKAKNSKVRIRGRCVQSNRSRSVSRLLRLSRIRIRTLALEGNIAGCTRATW